MENNSKIEEILGLLTPYIHPEYFKFKLNGEVDFGSRFELKKTVLYYKKISIINWFYKKTQKYSIYFNEFYTDNIKISNDEALEHHIHAYLEDLETLRNKINDYLGILKNDLKKIAINRNEVVNALEWLVKRINEIFQEVSKLRGEHRHHGYRFLDSDLVDIENYNLGLNNELFRNMMTTEIIDELEGRKKISFEKAKSKWINIAERNNPEITGLINALIEKTEDFLCLCLDIKLARIKDLSKKKYS